MHRTTAVLAVLLLISCSSSRQSNTSASAPPDDLRILLAEGGGFTGQWDGFEVDSAGGIMRLSGRPLGAVRTPAGRLSPDDLDALWGKVEASGFLGSEGSATPGNMSRTLAVTANGKIVTNTWPVSIPAASSLDSLYAAVRSFVVSGTH